MGDNLVTHSPLIAVDSPPHGPGEFQSTVQNEIILTQNHVPLTLVQLSVPAIVLDFLVLFPILILPNWTPGPLQL